MNSKIVFIVILLGLMFAAFAPYLFTRIELISGVSFGKANEVGDVIGGITSPFIGIISIALIYFAYVEQLKANTYLKEEVEMAKKSEKEKYENIKSLIIYDLHFNVKPELRNISKEIKSKLANKESWINKTISYNVYSHLNTKTFDSISKIDLFVTFPQEYDSLVKIYSSIDFIKNNTFQYLYLKFIDAMRDDRFVRDGKIVDSSKINEIYNNLDSIDNLCIEIVDKFILKNFPCENQE